jgi:uncharacterized membrane protein
MAPLAPVLICHIAAGSLAILSGAGALLARKGGRLHRASGTVFILSMLTVAMLAIYLAVFVPPVGATAVPPRASVAVAILTVYLLATGWMTVKREAGSTGLFETLAALAALGTACALAIFGLHATGIAPGRFDPPAPYFVFAGFAAFGAAWDLKVIVRGGISGAPRIARHLWRMCFALFFAAAFFFIGQQKVMPAYLHGAKLLLVPAFAPLAAMIVWLIRVRYDDRFKREA